MSDYISDEAKGNFNNLFVANLREQLRECKLALARAEWNYEDLHSAVLHADGDKELQQIRDLRERVWHMEEEREAMQGEIDHLERELESRMPRPAPFDFEARPCRQRSDVIYIEPPEVMGFRVRVAKDNDWQAAAHISYRNAKKAAQMVFVSMMKKARLYKDIAGNEPLTEEELGCMYEEMEQHEEKKIVRRKVFEALTNVRRSLDRCIQQASDGTN